MLIDEVHLLNESRGASLEGGVVSRIKMIGALQSMREVIVHLMAKMQLPSHTRMFYFHPRCPLMWEHVNRMTHYLH